MPVIARLRFCRFFCLLLMLQGLTQCAVLTRFQSPSRPDGPESAERQNPDDEEPGSKEDDEEGKNMRVIAVDQTPFFRWLRSGLKSEAKPSRFLDGGTEVELLKEKEEEKFSRVRLPGGKKGWVPSRLVREQSEGETANPEGGDSSVLEDSGEGSAGSDPVRRESRPKLEPSRLPDEVDDLPPLSEDIGQPIIPGFGIIEPRATNARSSDSSPVKGSEEAAGKEHEDNQGGETPPEAEGTD